MRTLITLILSVAVTAVLFGCASTVTNAPIDSRSNSKKPPVVTTSSDSAAKPAAATPAWTPPTRTPTPAPATKSATVASKPVEKPATQTVGKTSSKPAATTSYHVVKRGETLYSIAWHYGLNYRDLARANNIQSPYTIFKGQRLRVDAGGVPATATPPRSKTAAVADKPAAGKGATASKPASSAPPAKKPKTAGPAYDGKWVWPTRGRVLTRFQAAGTGKKGIDIGGHANQPVKAAANGKVVYAGSGLVGYGRLIIVKHNENLLSAYGHNNKLLVDEGEHVSAGQMIAKMGDSGTNRNELYFEIRKNGKPTDPLKFLPRQ